MNKKIGIIDSGIGGLTVVKAFQKLLPNEEIIYFGDNYNCPYGNRSKEEILQLATNILEFISKFDLKMIVIACNTISTLVDELRDNYDIKIFDVIRPTVDYIIKLGTYEVSLLATEFTVKTGTYQKLILAQNKDISIKTEGSKLLAGLIDKGQFDDEITKAVIEGHLDNLIKQGDCHNLILGCTHYPIVEDLFIEYAPDLNYIDPAYKLAIAVREYLYNNKLLNNSENGCLEIYTSGETDIYEKVIDRLKLKNVISINKV